MAADNYTIVLPIGQWEILLGLAKRTAEEESDEELRYEYYLAIRAASRQLGWGPY